MTKSHALPDDPAAGLPPPIRELFPFRMKTIPGGYGPLAFVDEDSERPPRAERPIVFLHGNPTWSFFYRGLIQQLRGQRRCLALDHHGCGLSGRSRTAPFDLQQRLRDLESWLETVVPGRMIDLVVHDWGGMIGFAWASRHPERVGRLVVLNTAAFFLDRLPWQIGVCRLPGIGPWLVRHFNAFARPATSLAVHRPMPKAVRAGYLWPYRTAADRRAIARFVQDIPLEASHPSRSILDETEGRLNALADKPMQIHWGMRDFCFDRPFLAEWRRRFPKAQAFEYPQAGHYVLEDAGHAIGPRICAFLI